MTHVDAINAAFEGGGACLLCVNVYRLRRDKTVKGVSLWPAAWWNVWGFWNVYFYSAVGTPASFWAGVAVVLVNTVWFGHALYYLTAEERAARRQFEAAMGGRPEPSIAPTRAADGGEWFEIGTGRYYREVMSASCPKCGGALYHGKSCDHGLT